MQVNRDQLFKSVQRIRKNIVQNQVDAWHGMLALLIGSRTAQLEIRATADGLTYREWILMEGMPPEHNFRATVGCEALYQALKSKWEDREIELSTEPHRLRINLVGSTQVRDMLFLSTELTTLQPEIDQTFEIEAGVLYGLLAQVEHARSRDKTREHMQGIELTCAGAMLRATATDGHRLATAHVLDAALTWEFVAVLTDATVAALLPALRRSAKDAKVTLGLGASAIHSPAITIESEEFSLSALLVTASFPPWRQVCPREDEGSRMRFCGVGETLALRNAIEQASRATNTDPGGLFTFDEQWLTIQVMDGENPSKVLETVRTEVQTPIRSYCNRGLKAKFNLAYWIEVMASIPNKTDIEIQFGSRELDEIAIHAGNATYVIMPMRL
jgi:DNA polymerase-3 subunit beta